jgi:putative endonuclease
VQNGFEVLARNWRGASGELDIVASNGSVLVFCEVKTRSGSTFGEPFEAVTAAKQARIRRLALEWLRSGATRKEFSSCDLRFDVASVKAARVDVLEAAF